MHEGPEGKAKANGGEALREKAILVTTPKLTSSPKAPLHRRSESEDDH
jgi:hypothetical protein